MFGPDDVNSTKQIRTIDYARANRETEMEMKEKKNENMPHMKYTLIVECMGWMREGERASEWEQGDWTLSHGNFFQSQMK